MIKNFITFILVVLFLNLTGAQITTDDCNSLIACYRFPDGCENSRCLLVYKWANLGEFTNFTLMVKIENGISIDSAWIAIAFSKDALMGDDSVSICKNSAVSQTIEQYFNLFHIKPVLLDSNNPNVGIESAKITASNGVFMCSFIRAKKNDKLKNYFNLNEPHYLLTAYGAITGGDIEQHVFKTATNEAVNFTSKIFTGSTSLRKNGQQKVEAHACLMIIAWLFGSTGLLVARYYKDIFPNRLICGVKTWFILHWPVMVSTSVLSIVAFIVILWDEGWNWVPVYERTEFTHSIFGIVAIFFAFLQISIAIFRCNPNHQYRFIFNNLHSILGITTYIIALVTLFLGSVLTRVGLSPNGYGLLIGWTFWVFLIFATIEITEFFVTYKRREQNNQMHDINNYFSIDTSSQKDQSFDQIKVVKLVLLALHLISALSFSIALIYLIVSA